MPETYIFGYGSLMNRESLQETLPGKRATSWTMLQGYRRVFNKAGRRRHRYLNLKSDPSSRVKGVLIKVTEDELDALIRREEGYDMVDVTEQIDPKPSANTVVYAFIAPPLSELKVSGSYLKKVLNAFPLKERERWLEETDFDGAEIDEDG